MEAPGSDKSMRSPSGVLTLRFPLDTCLRAAAKALRYAPEVTINSSKSNSAILLLDAASPVMLSLVVSVPKIDSGIGTCRFDCRRDCVR